MDNVLPDTPLCRSIAVALAEDVVMRAAVAFGRAYIHRQIIGEVLTHFCTLLARNVEQLRLVVGGQRACEVARRFGLERPATLFLGQIGRASCRERVCQYV